MNEFDTKKFLKELRDELFEAYQLDAEGGGAKELLKQYVEISALVSMRAIAKYHREYREDTQNQTSG